MNWSLYHYIMTFFTFCCSFGLKVYFLWLGTAISAFFCFPYMWSISFHTFILTQCVPFLFFCLFVFLSALHDLWDLRSSTKDWTHVLGVKAWSLNHWTSREFPQCVSLQLKWISYRQHIVGFWFFFFCFILSLYVFRLESLIHLHLNYLLIGVDFLWPSCQFLALL